MKADCIKSLYSYFLGAMILVVSTLNLHAQSLDYFLEKGLENNPSVQSQRTMFEASNERIKEFKSLDDPTLNLSFFPDPMMRYMGEQLGEVSVMQMLPWFGSRKAARGEAEYMAKMSQETWKEAQVNLQYRIKIAYWDLFFYQHEAELLQKEISLLKDLEKLVLKRYSTATGSSSVGSRSSSTVFSSGEAASGGGMSMGSGVATKTEPSSPSNMGSMSEGSDSSTGIIEILTLQVLIKELETNLAINIRNRKTYTNNLFTLVGETERDSLQISSNYQLMGMEAIRERYRSSTWQNHPMVAMNSWEQKAREQEMEMARKMGLPMVGVGLSYMVFRPRMLGPNEMLMENGNNMLMPMLSVTLPIYRSKTNAKIQQADILRQSAQFKEKAALDELEMLMREQWRALENLYDQQEILAKKEELTALSIRLLQAKIAVGQASMEDLVDKRQSLVKYQTQHLGLVVEERKILAALDLIFGADSF